MINAVGRDIPEEVLKATGKDIFRGSFAKEGYEYKKAAPTVRAAMDPTKSKLVDSIHDVLVKCGIKDGMTLSFHHHFREGDYVVNMVMEEVHKMGIKDITICASSLGKAHNPIVPMIEDGTITGIQEVVSFDENQIVLDTDMGLLTVKGKNLHVSRLTLEKGETDIDGSIDSLAYSSNEAYRKSGESLFSRLFR